jgi:hypothetical protein
MTIVCKPRTSSGIFVVAGLTTDGGRSMSRAPGETIGVDAFARSHRFVAQKKVHRMRVRSEAKSFMHDFSPKSA